MRTRIYVDGFNLYYRCLKRTPYKWLNLRALSKELLGSDHSIDRIKYFTADVSPRAGNTDAPIQQADYLRALKTLNEVDIYKGRFLPKKIRRPLTSDPTTFVEVHDTEEKGSDVNLASHLLFDAFTTKFEFALVLSQDTDLLEPIRMVTKELSLPVALGWSQSGTPGKAHRALVSDFRRISSTKLRRSQFPDQVTTSKGALISRPSDW